MPSTTDEEAQRGVMEVNGKVRRTGGIGSRVTMTGVTKSCVKIGWITGFVRRREHIREMTGGMPLRCGWPADGE